MRDTYGKNPTSRHKFHEDLNDAGEELFRICESPPWFHSWTWTSVADQVLPIRANEQFVRLPDDFATLIGVQIADRVTGGVMLTTPGHMIELRSDTTVAQTVIYMTFNAGDAQQQVGDAGPGMVAEIYPVQAEDRSDVRISYQRKWRRAEPNESPSGTDVLLDPNAIPNIPPQWEALLMLLCQRNALRTGDRPSAALEYDAPIGREIDGLVQLDSARQVNHGRVVQSVMNTAQASGGFQYPHNRIERI